MLSIDVIVGNPPYNNGIELDFIQKAFEVSEKYIVFITPAKWQTADKSQQVVSKFMGYGAFREEIVPFMREVVFYPYCKDVFNILQVDGITYYIIDKENKSECKVTNKSKHFEFLNGQSKRDISKGETLWNIGKEVIDSMGNYDKLKIQELPKSGKYQVWVNTQIPGGGTSTVESQRAILVLGEAKVCDRDAEVTHSPATELIFTANSLEECNNFMSYIYSTLVAFMLLINTSKLTGIINDHNFRLVPKETDFSHSYSNEYFYKKYNIKKEYIDKIEKLVKQRTIKL